MLKIRGGKSANEEIAFNILNAVSLADARWSIVYNISNKSIHFKTLPNKSIRTIDLANLDFSCNAPTSFPEVNNGKTFKKLKPDDNKKLLMDVFDKYTYHSLGKVCKKEFLNLVDFGNSIKCQ